VPSTTSLYTLSLHDALPISTFPYSVLLPVLITTARADPLTIFVPKNTILWSSCKEGLPAMILTSIFSTGNDSPVSDDSLIKKSRSEEHTSELQSRSDLVCRL